VLPTTLIEVISLSAGTSRACPVCGSPRGNPAGGAGRARRTVFKLTTRKSSASASRWSSDRAELGLVTLWANQNRSLLTKAGKRPAQLIRQFSELQEKEAAKGRTFTAAQVLGESAVK
jgi:hypothetical protein